MTESIGIRPIEPDPLETSIMLNILLTAIQCRVWYVLGVSDLSCLSQCPHVPTSHAVHVSGADISYKCIYYRRQDASSSRQRLWPDIGRSGNISHPSAHRGLVNSKRKEWVEDQLPFLFDGCDIRWFWA